MSSSPVSFSEVTAVANTWYLLLDGLTFTAAAIGTLVSIIFIATVVLHRRTCFSANNLISCNTLLATFLLSAVTLYSITTVLSSDMRRTLTSDPLCVWRSYFVYTEIAMLYYSFVTQAYYRYVRVIHSTRARYSSTVTLCSIMLMQWIVIHAVMLYLPLTGQIEFDAGSCMCTVPLTNYLVIWTMCTVIYAPAFNMIPLVYLRVILFMKSVRRRAVNLDVHRARRELCVLKRMAIVMFIFSVCCIPYSIFAFLAIFDTSALPVYHYRLITLFNTLALAVASCIILFQSTEVRQAIVGCLWNKRAHRVRPVPHFIA